METRKEPIAIIGMGCRFPGGANNLDQFWNLLKEGKDGVTETPADRWDADALYHPEYSRRGKINVKWGGYVDQIDMFDAQFFGISPMEARRMDPQQRMLLETSYTAMEDAGLNVDELSGEKVGVYLGISAHDYGDISFHPSERVNIDGKTITGGSASIAANRISYVYNFKGPSFSVDTACSSSLIATHVACSGLWNGECKVALVAGVNSLIKPEITMSFSTGGFLSPDGRCKTFDSRANGYIRSEGVGILVLKPLSKALEDGDRIYSTLIGSAINQDGATDGISMPSLDAQIDVLENAYGVAGIDPALVQYVEAHGTGTKVGDPIETNSIGHIIGQNKKKDEKLVIGSVKSNIGHLEPASGVAGLIKLCLSMSKKKIPMNVHFETPNPAIKFDEYNLKVPTELIDWPATKDGMFAGINSFGFGGANAHAVLMGYEQEEVKATKESGEACLFTISARSNSALKEYAESYIPFLSETDASLEDICFTANCRRSKHGIRASFVAHSKKELAEALQAWLDDETRPGMSSARAQILESKPKIAFVCSGQGPQWWGMARDLYAKEAVFKKVVDDCDAELQKISTEWTLKEEMFKDEKDSRISETRICQPAIFAVQVGLARLWESYGIKADAVVGHSIGEVASAHISGQISFEEACKVIFHRSRVQDMATGKGKMLAVGVSEEEALKFIEGKEDKVNVATINGPTLVTLSGDEAILEEVAKDLDAKDVFHRFLVVTVPFHSPYMEPLKPELLKTLKDIKFSEQVMPLYSTVTGGLYEGNYDAEYWYKNVRQAVRFTDVVDTMLEDDYTVFIELAPHPILLRYLDELMQRAGVKGKAVGSIRREEEDRLNVLGNIGSLFTWGYPVDFKGFNSGKSIDVPAYPFQKERFWVESSQGAKDRSGKVFHPFLTRHMESARDKNDHLWDIDLDKRKYPFIEDHRVQGPIIYPGAGSCEVTISCALDAFKDDFAFIEDINFKRAVYLPDDGEPPQIQFNLSKDDGSFFIYSRKDQNVSDWDRHIWGKIKHHDEKFVSTPFDFDAIEKRCKDHIDMAPMYEVLYKAGLQLGPSFRAVTDLHRGDTDDNLGETFGIVEAPDVIEDEIHEFNIHPSMLDACFQTLFGAPKRAEGEEMGVMIPVNIARLKFHKKATKKLYVYGRGTETTDMHMMGDITILDENKELCIELQGFKCRFIEGTRGEDAHSIDNTIYKWKWYLDELPSTKEVRDSNEVIPKLNTISKDMDKFLDVVKNREEMKVFNTEFEALLNKLTAQYIERAFIELGFQFKKGTKVNPVDFVKKYKVVEEHHRLVTHCFMILTESGVFSGSKDKGYTVANDLNKPDTEILYNELFSKYKEFHHELIMLHRCGPFLKDIFTGDAIAAQLLFPANEWEAIVDYYRQGYSFKKYNEIIQTAFTKLLKDMPKDKTLRILEIGGGTGGVTSAVLPVLPADRTTYTFTDVSSMFLSQTEKGFLDYPFMEYDVLDISGDPFEQGFKKNTYDIVIASDVLHATEDIHHNLAAIQELLAPNGMLCMLEVTGCPWYTDLIFGLTEGWWMYTDTDLRPDHATMNKEKWMSVFKDQKWGDVLALSDTERTDISAQTVFLARNEKAAIEPIKVELPEVYQNEGKMLILADNQGVADSLVKKFASVNEDCLVVTKGDKFSYSGDKAVVNPENSADFVSLFDKIEEDKIVLHGAVHCWNLDYPEIDNMSAEDLQKSLYSTSTSIIETSNQIHRSDDPIDGFQFWIVTSNAQNVGNYGPLSLAQSAAWGVSRTFHHEHQNIHVGIIDLSKDITEDEKQGLFEQILTDDGTEEAALRGKIRHRHKFGRSTTTEEKRLAMKKVNGYETPYHLVIHEQGVLDNLHFEEMNKKVVGDDEVEIQPKAMGLNFKDVMIAMGLLHEDAPRGGYTGYTYGMECTGVVSAVGSKVKDVKVGDRVMAISADSFSSQVVTKSYYTLPIPKDVSFEDAATLPFAYITAYYSLNYQGRMRKGDKVLIHSASGGVGIAAVRLAQAVGAEVYATAGSEEKREFVKSLGVKYVYNSRALTFADEIMDDTNGEGVDIILNSLSGSAIYKNISILNHYGRLVEIGKTDIYDNNTISLRPFGKNLSYIAVDIDKLLAQKMDLCGEVYKESMSLFKNNCPPAHPYKTFPISKVTDAFNFMGATKHLGKVIVVNDGEDVMVSPSTDITAALKEDGTYVIAGGFSGLGMSVTDWLVSKGVKNLLMISRSGAKTDEAKAMKSKWEKLGVVVNEAKCDVADSKGMSKIFADAKKNMPPIRGVINSVLVLDDCLMKDMTQERFMNAARPKIVGGWNLHNCTKDEPVDFFVNFSSIAGQWGSPAQANYSAGNVFQDMFSFHRHALGLQGSSISWGVIGQVGFVARDEGVSDILEAQGWTPYSPEQAIAVVEWMILSRFTHRGAIDADWQKIGEYFNKDKTSHRYEHLLKADDGQGGGDSDSLIDALAQLSDEARVDAIRTHVADRVGRILGTSGAGLDLEEPISNMGLDSLMANQLRNWIQGALEVDFSMMKIMRGPSIIEMCDQLLAEMGDISSAATGEDNRTEQEKWFGNITKPEAEIRLFCLPYMGGGATSFARWNALMPDTIDVVPVHLPGREDRADEVSIKDVKTLVKQMADAMEPLLDRPFALYGHSIGAAMAYRLEQELAKRKKHAKHLFVAAWLGPKQISPFDIIKGVSHDKIMDESGRETIYKHMRTLEISEDIISNKPLMDEMMPSIRADIIMGLTMEEEMYGEKINTPVTALAGKKDTVFSMDSIKEWKPFAAKGYEFHEVDGAHLFMGESQTKVLKLIKDTLK